MQVEEIPKPELAGVQSSPAETKSRIKLAAASSWRKSRLRFVAVGALVALLIGLAGGGGFGYVTLKRRIADLQSAIVLHLQKGQSELEAAKAALSQANATHDPKLIQASKNHFATARKEFLEASRTADSSSLLGAAEHLPAVGNLAHSQHQAVDGVAAMGVQTCLAGQDLADLDGQIVAPPPGQGTRTLLSLLNEVQSKIDRVRSELSAALRAAEKVDTTVLPATQVTNFEHAKSTIAVGIQDIDQFKALVPILNELLGGNGVRTYLVEQVNPAELRPGGGFIGSYSLLRVDHGSLSLIRSGDAAELSFPRASVGQNGYIAPPRQFERLIPGVGWSFIDSNFFPDFPSNAKWGASFASSRLGMQIDGVIAIDYFTVAGLLSVTGPMAVPGYGTTLTADNFIPTVVHYDIAGLTDAAAAAIHKAMLAAVAGPMLQKLVNLPAAQWPALIGTFNGLAAQRHLQAYFNNGQVENAMTQYGWSGIPKVGSANDYMMELEANLGGTKANYYVTRTYNVELTRYGATLHHRVTVDIKNDMPWEYRPGEYYRAYIRMLITDQTTAMATDLLGPQYSTPAPPAGTKALDGWITLHGYGHDQVIVFEWDSPWHEDRSGVDRIYWQKQPGTSVDKVQVAWIDGSGQVHKVTGDLAQDRVIVLGPRGVSLLPGQVGTAPLPSLGLGTS